MRRQYEQLQERSASTLTQMERTKRLLDRIRHENSRKSSEMDKLQQEFSSLGDRLHFLENKAMEVEKLEMAVDSLKKSLESSQQEVRERERDIRTLQRLLEEKDKKLTSAETQIVDLEEHNRDLKLQVREEFIKNTNLELKIENTAKLKESLAEKQEDIESLKQDVNEQHLIAKHARKCLKEEKDQRKKLEERERDIDELTQEVEILRSENTTLKSLLSAKDSLIRQRAKDVNSLKNELQTHTTEGEFKEIIQDLESNQQRDISYCNGTSVTSGKAGKHQKARSRVKSAPPNRVFTRSTQPLNDKSSLFRTILDSDRTNSSDETDINSTHPKTAIVRPRVYQDSFSDFRSNSPSRSVNDLASVESSSCHDDSHDNRNKIRKTQSMRSSSLSGSKSMTSSSVEHLQTWTGNRKCSGEKEQSQWNGHMMMNPTLESRLMKCIKLGDRIVVDITKKKGNTRDLNTGVVKYIGNLETEKDPAKIFVGLKLDGPDGDTDGLIRGKRYFRVSPCHGKFVRIQKVLSVFNKQNGAYQKMEELLNSDSHNSQVSLQSIH